MTHDEFIRAVERAFGDVEAGDDRAASLAPDAEAHAATCAECGRLLAALRQVEASPQGLDDEPPAGYWAAFDGRLATRLTRAAGAPRRWPGAMRAAWPLLAAAAALLAAVLLATRWQAAEATAPSLAARPPENEPDLPAPGRFEGPIDGQTAWTALDFAATDETSDVMVSLLEAGWAPSGASFLDSIGERPDAADGGASSVDWTALDEADVTEPLLSSDPAGNLSDALLRGLDEATARELARRIREDMSS